MPSYEDDDHEQAAGNAGETHSAEDAHAWASCLAILGLPPAPHLPATYQAPGLLLKAHTKVAEFLA